MGGNVQAKMTSVAATKAVRARAERVGTGLLLQGLWRVGPRHRRHGDQAAKLWIAVSIFW